jgi:hypothetical protein
MAGPELAATARGIADNVIQQHLLPQHLGKASMGPYAGDWTYEWVRLLRNHIAADVVGAWLCGHRSVPLGSVLKEVPAS